MATAEKVYDMLGNDTLWSMAERCHSLLSAAEIPYSICGGVAVCLHGYQRNTVGLDLVLRACDPTGVRDILSDAGLDWNETNGEFRTPSGIAVHFLMAGQPAGKASEVSIPEPIGEENVELIEGLSVVRLSRLIEMKIACGISNLRRTHKDLADVVELIAVRNLDGSFARHIHPSLRPTFREPVLNANATE